MKWMLTAILCICGVSVFTACTPDNNDNPAGDGDLTEKVVGKWIAETDGETVTKSHFELTLAISKENSPKSKIYAYRRVFSKFQCK